MPSLSEQIRTVRHRRARRRRAIHGGLVGIAVLLAVVMLSGTQFVAGESAESADERSTVPPTSAPPSPPATGLDPGLVDAIARAQAEAAVVGHDLTITSGFRTAEQQAAMLDAEIAERGSVEEASWWVFPPERSMHVQGLAIDVGDGPAADWLAAEGARFGLCRTLEWEWWHFEWRERWEAAGTCPAPAEVPEDAPQP